MQYYLKSTNVLHTFCYNIYLYSKQLKSFSLSILLEQNPYLLHNSEFLFYNVYIPYKYFCFMSAPIRTLNLFFRSKQLCECLASHCRKCFLLGFALHCPTLAANVPAVCDVLPARIRALRSKDQGWKNVGAVSRGKERSD
jgi:hypothetical protein